MTLVINKLNISSNSQVFSKSRLNSFDHLKRWGISINSSLSSLQREWNQILFPLLFSLPQVPEVNAWTNGLDGRSIYVDRSADSLDSKFYNFTKYRPKTIEESILDSFISLDQNAKDIEILKDKARSIGRASSNTFSLSGDVSGLNNNNIVEKIQNREVSDDAPSDNYVLAWEDSSSSWKPISKSGDPPYPADFISGLNLSFYARPSEEQILISAGVCRSDDDTTNIRLSSDTIFEPIVNPDTGSFTSSPGTQFLYIWLFYNPSTEAISIKSSIQYPGSGTDPTAPAGYTKKRYIGNVLLRQFGANEYLQEFYQTGQGSVRTYFFNWAHYILLEGAALTWTTCSQYQYDFQGNITGNLCTPATASIQIIGAGAQHQFLWNSEVIYIRSQGSSSTNGSFFSQGYYTKSAYYLNILGDRNIEYKVGSVDAEGLVHIQGYVESL